jgi:hypothetical protein
MSRAGRVLFLSTRFRSQQLIMRICEMKRAVREEETLAWQEAEFEEQRVSFLDVVSLVR